MPEIPHFLQEHDALIELVQRCWAKEPAERPTANEVQMSFEHELAICSRRWWLKSVALSFVASYVILRNSSRFTLIHVM